MRTRIFELPNYILRAKKLINTQISTYKTKWINYCLFFYFSPLAFVSLNQKFLTHKNNIQNCENLKK